jgi:hypothetical protein
MATGQTILNLMEALDRGLQLQSGESGVTLALRAVNAAQDYLESLLALQPNSFLSSTGTVTTTADTETTAFPSGLIRLDRLQYLNASTSRPAWDLEWVGYIGDQNGAQLTDSSVQLDTTSTGKPRRYSTNGRNIYWGPLPDAAHSVRYYGLVAADDITASGTFAYPDIAITAVADYAVKLLRIGKDDDAQPVSAVGVEIFTPCIELLGRFNRDRAPGYDYRYYHST